VQKNADRIARRVPSLWNGDLFPAGLAVWRM